MANKIDFIPVIPPAMRPSEPYSSSDAIAARREKVFIPDSQTTYSFDTNDQLTFTLNSSNEMLDGQNSWLEFDLNVASTGAAIGNAGYTSYKIIDAGGAHALFRRLRVSLSNGTQIEDIVGYNKLYSIIRHNTMSENQVKYVEGPLSGDGMSSSLYENGVQDERLLLTFDPTTAQYTAVGTLFSTLAGRAQTELVVGDYIEAYVGNVLTVVGYVLNVVDNNSFTVTLAFGGAANIAAGAITRIVVKKATPLYGSSRATAGSTAGIKLKMKPLSNFFTNAKYIPLMFLKNLQLTFELERGALAFKLPVAPGVNASVTYTITNPRLVCSMVTPSEPYLQSALDAYNTPEGLYYPFISYQHNMKSAGAQNESITIPSNCRSARAFIAAQYLALSEGVVAESYVNDCISTTVKNLMTQFQVKIGSENYPYARPVNCDGIFNGEALAHLQKALDLHGNITQDNSMIPYEYWSVNVVNGVANESKRFVMGVPLARDISSEATGVDLINNDVQLEIIRSGAPVACFIRSWVIYDSAVQISRMGTTVYK